MSFPNAPRLSDSIASKLVEGGEPSNLDNLQFNSVTNLWEFVAGGGGGAFLWTCPLHRDPQTFGSTEVFALGGGEKQPTGRSAATEEDYMNFVPVATTFSQFIMHISVNTFDGDTVYQTLVGTFGARVAGNLTITVGAGLTGSFIDAVNSDVLAIGDFILGTADNTASGAGALTLISSGIRGSA